MSALLYILVLLTSRVTVGKLLNSSVHRFSPFAKGSDTNIYLLGGLTETMRKALSTVPAWHTVNLQCMLPMGL